MRKAEGTKSVLQLQQKLYQRHMAGVGGVESGAPEQVQKLNLILKQHV